MAKRDQQQRKLELLEKLSRQRAQITSQRSRLITQIADKKEEFKDKINVPKRIKSGIRSSFSSSPTKWFLGSAVGGLIISKMLFGKKKHVIKGDVKAGSVTTTVSRGFLSTAMMFLVKPMIKKVLINKAKGLVLSRFVKTQPQISLEQHEQQYYR